MSVHHPTGKDLQPVSMDAAPPGEPHAPVVETCANCGLPLIRRGAQEECLRCALALALSPAGSYGEEEGERAEGIKSDLPGAPRRFGHFGVERGFDGRIALR